MHDRPLFSTPSNLTQDDAPEPIEPIDEEIQPASGADADRDKYDIATIACTD